MAGRGQGSRGPGGARPATASTWDSSPTRPPLPGTRTALLGTLVSRPQTDRSRSATGRCERDTSVPRTCRSQVILVPTPATAIREGAGPVAAHQCTGRPLRSAAESAGFAASRRMPRATSSTGLPHYPPAASADPFRPDTTRGQPHPQPRACVRRTGQAQVDTVWSRDQRPYRHGNPHPAPRSG